jgi:MFS transporter, DHA1 family, tetracycline resistance protein
MNLSPDKKPLVVIFITVFIYLLGFGMVLPIIPLLSLQYGASAFQAGLLMSVYSFMQFLFSPFWGRLSDKYGRRPILLFCLAGEVFSYLFFAWSKSLEMLFLARLFSGFFGASISTASAYISDITPKNERSKGMALIGAAFGLGFLFGPAIGGGLSLWAEQLSNDVFFKTSFSSYWVAGFCFLTFIYAYKNLKESLSPEHRSNAAILSSSNGRLSKMLKTFKQPNLGSLMIIFFLTSTAMALMEATLILLVKEKFSWGLKEVSFGFAYIGVMIVITQGFLVRRLIPKFGEKVILRFGLVLITLSFFGIAFSTSIAHLAITQTLLALGIGLTNPSTLGAISLSSPSEEQGVVLGTAQGFASLGRIIGPALGGALFSTVGIRSPFLTAGIIGLVAFLMVIRNYELIPNSGKV